MKFTKRTQPGQGQPTNYLKLKNGESKTGVLQGEIHEFFVKWLEGKSKVVTKDTPEAKSRFKINFISHDDNKQLKAFVWEFGIIIYNKLAAISEDFDLSKTTIKIKREGTGTDTEYHIVPLGPVSNLDAVKAVELNILDTKKPQKGEQIGEPTANDLNDFDEMFPPSMTDDLPF